jgi:hypothetical protein
MDTLCSVGAIDKELWQEKKIWSQNLVNNLQPVYTNRRRKLPEKPVNTCRNITADELLHVETAPEQSSYALSTIETPQSKVKRSRVKKVKEVCVECLLLGSAKNVKLTQEEYDELRALYPSDVEDIVEFLSLQIAEKGDKSTAKTHIFTIKKWVVDAVRDRKSKGWKGYGLIGQMDINGLIKTEQQKKPLIYESRL